MEVKRRIFSQLENLAARGAILASNSSHLEPESIFEELRDATRVSVVHYFFPAERNWPSASNASAAAARCSGVRLLLVPNQVNWTRPQSKTSVGYGVAMIFGGFAAPLFLWLAGLGTAMAAFRTGERTGSRARAVEATCRRGLEIFILAFLFRLQSFVLSPGSPIEALLKVDILNIMGPAIAMAALLWATSERRMLR